MVSCSGQSMAEYALTIAVITLVCIVAVQVLGNTLQQPMITLANFFANI